MIDFLSCRQTCSLMDMFIYAVQTVKLDTGTPVLPYINANCIHCYVMKFMISRLLPGSKYSCIIVISSIEERKSAPIIFKVFATSFDEAIKSFQEVYSCDLFIVYLWTAHSGYILRVFIVFNLS